MNSAFGSNRLGRTRTCDLRIMLTNYDFRRPFRVCGLDHLFPLRVRRMASTPSSYKAWLGISISTLT
jgi:hypothetical protein